MAVEIIDMAVAVAMPMHIRVYIVEAYRIRIATSSLELIGKSRALANW